jgi:Ser/Thr protein kinase RdoA (MazF antagonist)
VRVVTLVLVSPSGDLLGRLPAFPVETPWWQDARPVVAGARVRFGLQVTILRLLESERPSAPGGGVTYLAEVDPGAVTGTAQMVELEPWDGTLDDDPRRLPYARLGGPATDLAWADDILAGLGKPRNGPAEQDRTWNLSSLWRLPLSDGAAWLKVVPPSFEHEGRILERLGRLDGEAVPHLLGHDRGRMLLAEIPGSDRYDASGSELIEMVDALVDLQARWSGRIAELLDLGLPDWRARALGRSIAEVVDRTDSELTADDQDILARFVAALPDRFATIESLGLPEGLVHGDFHTGNVRGEPGALVLLDWGDSGIGHPLLDQPAFLTRIDPAEVDMVRDHWHAAWRRAVPGSDPDRASSLLAPVAAARQAAIYRRFLDNIEASEQPYHRADVPDWLRRTAEILRGERRSSHRRST